MQVQSVSINACTLDVHPSNHLILCRCLLPLNIHWLGQVVHEQGTVPLRNLILCSSKTLSKTLSIRGTALSQIGLVCGQNLPIQGSNRKKGFWFWGQRTLGRSKTPSSPKLKTLCIFLFSNHRSVLQRNAYKGQSDGKNIAQDILMRKQLADGQFDADNFWPDIRTGRRLGAIYGTLLGH